MTTPFEIKMTEKEAFDGLKSNYGTEFTAADRDWETILRIV